MGKDPSAFSAFDRSKAAVLQKLKEAIDKSPKGSLDEPIVHLIHNLNGLPDLVTTSSCSGRISLFHKAPLTDSGEVGTSRWVFVKHGPIAEDELSKALDADELAKSKGLITLKVEPFIMHLQARTPQNANDLLQIALAAGFRESGIILGKKKTMVAVRTTSNSMEVPLCYGGRLLVSNEYLNFVAKLSNERMLINERKIRAFENAVKGFFGEVVVGSIPPSSTGVHQEGDTVTLSSTSPSEDKLRDTSLRKDGSRETEDVPSQGDSQLQTHGGHSHSRKRSVKKQTRTPISGDTPSTVATKIESSGVYLKRSLHSYRSSPPPSLQRWGHAACSKDNYIYVFGGYLVSKGRTNDLIIVECERRSQKKKIIRIGDSTVRGEVSTLIVDSGCEEMVAPRDSLGDAPSTRGKEHGETEGLTLKLTEVPQLGERPSPRMKHSLSTIEGLLVVYGGRASPAKVFADICVFDLNSSTWLKASVSGDAPPPRFGHLAIAWCSSLYVFGGVGADGQPLNDLYRCDGFKGGKGETLWLTWRCLRPHSELEASDVWPVARSSMACCHLPAGKLLMHGGVGRRAGVERVETRMENGEERRSTMNETRTGILDDLWILDLESSRFHRLRYKGQRPAPRFSHSMCYLGKGCVAVIGGVTGDDDHTPVAILGLYLGPDLENTKYARTEVLYNRGVDVDTYRHTLCALSTLLNDNNNSEFDEEQGSSAKTSEMLCLLGGGGVCFGFGNMLSPVIALEAGSLRSEMELRFRGACGSEISGKQGHSNPAWDKSTLSDTSHDTAGTRKCTLDTPFIIVPMDVAKLVKDELKAKNAVDRTKRVTVLQDQEGKHAEFLAIPITENSVGDSGELCIDTSSCKTLKSNAHRVRIEMRSPGTTKITPTDSFRERIINRVKRELPNLDSSEGGLASSGLCDETMGARIAKELPTRFERIGDILMIPRESFRDPCWNKFEGDLWRIISEEMGVKRVARKSRIDPGPKRESLVKLLYSAESMRSEVGDKSFDGWVEIKENGLSYGWDITKVMFSSGNVTEKKRMAEIGCRDEVIVDMYAGIGYFTIPLLVHGRASFVHALEWNDNSILALTKNLWKNGVQDRCQIHVGDNIKSAPALFGIADRVLLGLIPDSSRSWASAMSLLKVEGGWIHVHGLSDYKSTDVWAEGTATTFRKLAMKAGRRWCVRVQHVEKVKSYAPKILHVVVDLHCQRIPEQDVGPQNHVL